MKRILLTLIVLGTGMAAMSQALKTPSPSTTQTVKQEFGLSTVELSYSRPGMKGRKIFGDLVPFGQVWRTGANGATTLTFGDEVTIGGKKIPAGKYGLLTIPGASEWTIIITKQLDVTSPAAYKADQDVVRTTVKPTTLPFSVETFMILFTNVKPSSLTLELIWDNVEVDIPVTTDVDSKVMAEISESLNKDNKPYGQAAQYYMDNGKDLNQALVWYDKAIAQQPDAFWLYYQKANCQAKLGKKADAIATSNKSIELAKAAQNSDYVTLNQKLQASLK
jgi:Protein of unknown function (DUF2911)